MAETKTTKTTTKAATAQKATAAVKSTTTKTTATKTASVAKSVAPKATATKVAATKTAVKTEVKTAEKKVAEKKIAKPVANGKIRVTMVHGLASCTKRQIRTAKALKLSRPGDTRELPNLPSTLGACKKLEHLVKVEII
jgi:ribosomal protein L30/L7E